MNVLYFKELNLDVKTFNHCGTRFRNIRFLDYVLHWKYSSLKYLLDFLELDLKWVVEV